MFVQCVFAHFATPLPLRIDGEMVVADGSKSLLIGGREHSSVTGQRSSGRIEDTKFAMQRRLVTPEMVCQGIGFIAQKNVVDFLDPSINKPECIPEAMGRFRGERELCGVRIAKCAHQ